MPSTLTHFLRHNSESVLFKIMNWKHHPCQDSSSAANGAQLWLARNERMMLEYYSFPLSHRQSAAIITGKVDWLALKERKPVIEQKNRFVFFFLQNNGSEMLMRLTSAEGEDLPGECWHRLAWKVAKSLGHGTNSRCFRWEKFTLFPGRQTLRFSVCHPSSRASSGLLNALSLPCSPTQRSTESAWDFHHAEVNPFCWTSDSSWMAWRKGLRRTSAHILFQPSC